MSKCNKKKKKWSRTHYLPTVRLMNGCRMCRGPKFLAKIEKRSACCDRKKKTFYDETRCRRGKKVEIHCLLTIYFMKQLIIYAYQAEISIHTIHDY